MSDAIGFGPPFKADDGQYAITIRLNGSRIATAYGGTQDECYLRAERICQTFQFVAKVEAEIKRRMQQ